MSASVPISTFVRMLRQAADERPDVTLFCSEPDSEMRVRLYDGKNAAERHEELGWIDMLTETIHWDPLTS